MAGMKIVPCGGFFALRAELAVSVARDAGTPDVEVSTTRESEHAAPCSMEWRRLNSRSR
jgi:hypothetical protein